MLIFTELCEEKSKSKCQLHIYNMSGTLKYFLFLLGRFSENEQNIEGIPIFQNV